MPLTLADCRARDDATHGVGRFAQRFAPGEPGTLYLDASSIGPMPADVPRRMQALLEQGWSGLRRRGWNELDWLQQPRSIAAGIAHLVGARPDDLRIADSTSVNQYKLLRYALACAGPHRRVIVAERDVFPSNRYVAEGIARAGGAQLRLVDGAGALDAALAPGDVAVVTLSLVDYRSSERLDMPGVTAAVHRGGALALWDLSHAAGAVAIDLAGSDADLAVGCGYKYLCGGPGAPAFVYVHPRHAQAAWPAVCGWMGHADTFAFEPDYRPAAGADRFLVGTPPVVANAAFAAAADVWREVDPQAMHARHRSLGDTLIALLDEQCAQFGVCVTSPRAHDRRGGHVAVRFDGASALAQALVDRKVVVSARKPDSLRFAVHPLATTHEQLWQAVRVLRDILATAAWRDPTYNRAAV